MTSPSEITPQPLTPEQTEQAVQLGLFVNIAYAMYVSAPTNPAPPPPPNFIPGYEFVAWVQMQDFLFSEGALEFYGLIAQRTSKPNEFVLAIRGTSDPEEWVDDITSMFLDPFLDPSLGWGSVGYGFKRIYQTMRVVDYAPPTAGAERVAPPQPSGTFAQQVAAVVGRRSAHRAPEDREAAEAAPAPQSITVTGHSLGSALATLYVADNSTKGGQVATPLLCTFASPRVGDQDFANKFDQLGIGSWRIVNLLDLVPNLPFLGFVHVAALYLYIALSVELGLECEHSILTYLNMLDPRQPILPECKRPSKASLRASAKLAARAPAPAAPAEKTIALSAPAQSGGTINITINIGRTD